MKITLLDKIKNLMEEQKECEILDGYDDHGNYFDAGYYQGYIDALTMVFKIAEKYKLDEVEEE